MKNIILKLLQLQTKRFLKNNQAKLIVVTGSIGKTSTKLAIATVLSRQFRVLVHFGNHNTHFSVPLAIFDISYPDNVKNPFKWLKVLWQMEQKIQRPFEYDVILLELGTDHPGEIPYFGTYLQPDIAVVTAVAPEHMEFFKTMDAVAKEELSVANYSKLVIVNRDSIAGDYAKYVDNQNIDTYGISGAAEYRYIVEDYQPASGFVGKLVTPEFGEQSVKLNLVGEHNILSAVAAAAVGTKMAMKNPDILAGLEQIVPVNGRMRLLRGLLGTTLIDDTYNSSPTAALAALQTLYRFPSKQKIAIMGSMNELGEMSESAHKQVGLACDPVQLDWMVTIGDQAQKYLAPAASSRGCQVRSFKTPYQAGSFVHSVLHPGAVVLAKGSQNGVFAEEALKVILHSTEEESSLVRQEPEWLASKQKQFDRFK